MDISMFYVYKVICKPTNQYYIGSRTAKCMQQSTPMEDLFIRYFTSSQDVKKLIDTYGTDAFEKLILIEDCNSDVILYKENEIIKEHINDELCLNKFYHNSDCERKFSTSGTKVYKNAEGLYIKRKHHPGEGWTPEGVGKNSVW